MTLILRSFLVCIAVYSLLHTLIGFGLGRTDPFIFSVLKDLLWVIVFVSGCVLGVKKFGSCFAKKRSSVGIIVIILVLLSLGISFMVGIRPSTQLIGFKYDIYPVIVLAMACFLGEVYRKTSYHKEKLFTQRIDWIAKGVIGILVVGLLWQVGKIVVPELYMWFGYGAVGDYVLGSNPPLYYRTGPGGMMRLSGLFAGPNNLGYFLVVFFSFLMMWLLNLKSSRLFKISILVLYVFCLGRTLSRGAWIGVGVQMLLGVRLFYPQRKKHVLGVCLLGVVGIGVLSLLKSGSTIGHIVAWQEGGEAFLQQPFGYGLGSAGPAVHFDGVYLPENQYLQILLDVGIVGFILRISVFFLIFPKRTKLKNSKDQSQKYLIALLLGFVGVAVEGLFLHVLEDSMVNYLFFVVFGIIYGYFYVTNES